jgi:glycosyltransferase involved in cell wall biosynthesis
MLNAPLISVLLPVYNAAPYVGEAIESILGQTYRHWELIVINDGSTDGSDRIVKAIQDPRIRVIDQPNRGLSMSLNRAIGIARGDYVARQDADDIALPRRFERQIDYLGRHPVVGMVGTWAEVRSDDSTVAKVYAPSVESHVLKFDLLFDNPFVHSSMMIRRQVLDRVGTYSEDSDMRAEDYELWSRVGREYEIANIPDTLQIYRDAPKSKLKKERSAILENVIDISIANLAWTTNRDRSDSTVNDLAALAHGAYHRVGGQATLHDLTELLFEAAGRLSQTEHDPAAGLQEKAHAQCQTLHYHYDLYRRYYKGGRLRRKVVQLSEMVKHAISVRRSSVQKSH